MVFFFVKPAQIYSRVLSHSKTMDEARVRMILQQAHKAHVARRVQSRVYFPLRSTEINSSRLQTVNEEGTKKNKRARYVQKTSRKITPLLEEGDAIEKKLRDSSSALTYLERQKLLKRQKKLGKRADSHTRLARKTYLGRRYKRWFFLKGRKGSSRYLAGKTFPDEITSSDWLWITAAEENIFKRSFKESFREWSSDIRQTSLPLAPDEIRRGLAEEFSQKVQQRHLIGDKEEHIKSVEQVLGDIERIFDSSRSKTERYFQVLFLKGFFADFIYHYLFIVYRELESGEEFPRFKHSRKLLTKLFRLIYLSNEYSDFLISASMTKNKKSLAFYKYPAMENLLKFFEYLIELPEIVKGNSGREEILSRLEENLQKIESFAVGREKKMAGRRLGLFGRKTPRCEEMVRK